MKNYFTLNLDLVGFYASLLCAIHCTVVPLLLTISTWSGLQLLSDPSIEIMLLCLSTLLALASILPSYTRVHRKLNAMVLVTIGFILIGLGRLEVEKVWEMFSTSVGAAFVASAHIINWRLCRNSRVNHASKE